MPSICYSQPASLLLTSRCSRVFRIRHLLQESSSATSVSAPAVGENNTVTERRASSHFPTDPSSEYPVVFDKKREFPTRLGFRLLLQLERGQRAARCSTGLVNRLIVGYTYVQLLSEQLHMVISLLSRVNGRRTIRRDGALPGFAQRQRAKCPGVG